MFNRINIRNASLEDIQDLNVLDHKVWPSGSQTTSEMWESRIKTNPRGVIIAKSRDKIIGVVVIELLMDYNFSQPKSWYDITDNGLLKNSHHPNGKIIYGVALTVDQEYQNKGVGTKLSMRILRIIFEDNISSMILGARLINYHKYSSSMTPNEYVKKAFEGDNKLFDTELNFYKKLGFHPKTIVPNYFHDHESLNYGVLIQWNNPFHHNIFRFPLILFFKLFY